jgi:hypothetical protein
VQIGFVGLGKMGVSSRGAGSYSARMVAAPRNQHALQTAPTT